MSVPQHRSSSADVRSFSRTASAKSAGAGRAIPRAYPSYTAPRALPMARTASALGLPDYYPHSAMGPSYPEVTHTASQLAAYDARAAVLMAHEAEWSRRLAHTASPYATFPASPEQHARHYGASAAHACNPMCSHTAMDMYGGDAAHSMRPRAVPSPVSFASSLY
jgi:hypothetical protein